MLNCRYTFTRLSSNRDIVEADDCYLSGNLDASAHKIADNVHRNDIGGTCNPVDTAERLLEMAR